MDGSDSDGSLDGFIVADSDPDADGPTGGSEPKSRAAAASKGSTSGEAEAAGAGGASGGSGVGKAGSMEGRRQKGAGGKEAHEDGDSDGETKLAGELFGLISRGDSAGLSALLGHTPKAARWSGPESLEGAAGMPALHWAVMQHKADCVELLAKAGAQVSPSYGL